MEIPKTIPKLSGETIKVSMFIPMIVGIGCLKSDQSKPKAAPISNNIPAPSLDLLDIVCFQQLLNYEIKSFCDFLIFYLDDCFS